MRAAVRRWVVMRRRQISLRIAMMCNVKNSSVKAIAVTRSRRRNSASIAGQTAPRADIKASGDFHLMLVSVSGNAILQPLHGGTRRSLLAGHRALRSIHCLELWPCRGWRCRYGHGAQGSRHRLPADGAQISPIEADLDLRERKSFGLKEVLPIQHPAAQRANANTGRRSIANPTRFHCGGLSAK
jgi:hypothetical protein